MDYATFFDDLETCYKENEIQFRCSYSSAIRNFIVSVDPNAPELQKEEITYTWDKNKKHFAGQFLNHKSFDFKVFKTKREVIYYLAWELACVIGRLPDKLHARMVLSTDRDPFLKTYLRSFC